MGLTKNFNLITGTFPARTKNHITIGDGTTSTGDYNGATDAIIKSALLAVQDGGTVELLEGTWTISNDVFLTRKNITIRGSGPGTILNIGNSKSLRLFSNNSILSEMTLLSSGVPAATYEQITFSDLVEVADASSTGVGASIATDSYGYAHISYRNSAAGNLFYVTNSSGSWVSSDLGFVTRVLENTSIGIDTNNKVHIAYISTLFGLHHITNASGAWVDEAVDPLLSYNGCSLAIDLLNNIHISYIDSAGNLGYAHWNTFDSTWNIDNTIVLDAILETSIAIDSSNNPHIALIYSNADHWVGYIKKSGVWPGAENGAWLAILEDVYSGVLVRSELVKIAIDQSDFVHIVFSDYDNNEVNYANNVSGWDNDIIDISVSIEASGTSIKIDQSGYARIGYGLKTQNSLKQATATGNIFPISWTIKVLDSAPISNVDYINSSLDIDGNLHVVYNDATGTDVKYCLVNGATLNVVEKISLQGVTDPGRDVPATFGSNIFNACISTAQTSNL
jgi:hypothetical protein